MAIYGVAKGANGDLQAKLLTRHSRCDVVTRMKSAGPGSPGSTGSSAVEQRRLTFGGESFTDFFRHLAFSPDGSLLICPAAQSAEIKFNQTTRASSVQPMESLDDSSKVAAESRSFAVTGKQHSSMFIYGRANITRQPLAELPSGIDSSSVIRFSPILYLNQTTKPLFSLPYRMIYAVVTPKTITIHDTEQAMPLMLLSNLHHRAFSDIAWSPDGQTLIMAANDGYCTLAVFDHGELGERAEHQREIPEPKTMEVRASSQNAVRSKATATPKGSETVSDAAPADVILVKPVQPNITVIDEVVTIEPKKKKRSALLFATSLDC